MPKPIKTKNVIRVLKKHGFFLVRQRGSHARYQKVTVSTTYKVTVKVTEKEIPFGTFNSILFQSGLKVEDFNDK